MAHLHLRSFHKLLLTPSTSQIVSGLNLLFIVPTYALLVIAAIGFGDPGHTVRRPQIVPR